MYTYRMLMDALEELNEEELDQAVVIIDQYEAGSDSVFLVSATDSFDKYGSNMMKGYQGLLPEGQKVLVLDGTYVQKENDILIHYENGKQYNEIGN